MSNSDFSIIEACSCGATLSISTGYHAYVTSEASAWRKDHRHESPPIAKPERTRIPLARSRA